MAKVANDGQLDWTPDILVPFTESERQKQLAEMDELERTFVRDVGNALRAKLSGHGMILVDLVGHSRVGWTAYAQLGDGYRVSAHLERQEALQAPEDERIQDYSGQILFEALMVEADRHINPPPETRADMMRSIDGSFLQVGEGLRDALGDEYFELKEHVEAGIEPPPKDERPREYVGIDLKRPLT